MEKRHLPSLGISGEGRCDDLVRESYFLSEEDRLVLTGTLT
jgi:hypothetical protein